MVHPQHPEGGDGAAGVGGGGGDVAGNHVLLLDTRKRCLDVTAASLSSSQQSFGPRESTPLNSQDMFDSLEFFREEVTETEPPIKVTKLTKDDAYKLLQTASSGAEAALEAVKTLVGGNMIT